MVTMVKTIARAHRDLYVAELGPIPVRNWNCLPIPIPELELELNWLFPVWPELELNWNCQYLNWNWIGIAIIWIGIGVGIAFYGIGFGIAFHGIEIRYEVPHILIYSSGTIYKIILGDWHNYLHNIVDRVVWEILGRYFPGSISREIPPHEILPKVGNTGKYWEIQNISFIFLFYIVFDCWFALAINIFAMDLR